MKKVFSLLMITICLFGFVSVVDAEEAWSSISGDVNFINDLISGEDLTSNSSAKDFFTKYDVYYKYQKIDDSTYTNYMSDISKGTSTGAVDAVNASIPSVSSVDQLGSWIKVTEPKFIYTDISYDSTKKTGYIVAVAAVDKADNTKIYVDRVIYEVNSSNKLVNSYDLYNNSSVNTNDDATNQTTSEENPDTGINEYVIYLVPIALIGGTMLMMRKNFV